MKQNKICKICERHFANGKAIGGHMRSHLAKFPLPPKPLPIPPSVESIHCSLPTPTPPSPTCFPSSSFSMSFHLKKDPMQCFRSPNHDLSASLSVNSDRESETELYQKNPTRRRSNRLRKSVLAEQPVSSISYTLTDDQEAAMCLIMLSRDKWPALNEAKEGNKNDLEDGFKVVIVDEEEDDKEVMLAPTSKRTKYQCETCKKVFQSYQALGGHRSTSHKKMKNPIKEKDVSKEEGRWRLGGDSIVDQKNFECPFCFAVFESGHALGEHKKVHYSVTSIDMANARNDAGSRFGEIYIDLNLPAPVEDGEIIHVVF
ncbi:Zinc finger protein [Quillaja saponaria]|uniref:Zinc finger protein n=1 Tax=Quillaja saponaria TaxID=32244 RepID=A0AAD7QJF3_QUISA|nr:Zinc finger protein [Quillaja saponaria]